MSTVELLKQHPLSEYLKSRGMTLIPAGKDRFKCRCPFHEDLNPSMFVDDKFGTFKCFVCADAHGDIIDFVRMSEGVQFQDALARLCEEFGIEASSKQQNIRPEKAALEALAIRYEQALKAGNAKGPKEYLLSRGFSEDVLTRFRVGFADSATPVHQEDESKETLTGLGYIKRDGERSFDLFQNRIMFPIRNIRGEVCGFGGRVLPAFLKGKTPKYINSGKSHIFDKSALIYGLFEALGTCGSVKRFDRLFVVEGYMDVIACHSIGVSNVVAACGVTLSNQQVQTLLQFTDHLVFVFDGDNAGQSARSGVIETVLPFLSLTKHLSFVTLADGLDPGQYIEDKKPEALKAKLNMHRGVEEYLKQSVDAVQGHSAFSTSCLRKNEALRLTEGVDDHLRVELLNYVLS